MSILIIRRRAVGLGIAVAGLVILIAMAGTIYAEPQPVLSYAVANQVIVIDPGHGGIDPGAIGHNGAVEKDINLAVAKKLRDHLAGAGAMVIMTREDDRDLSGSGEGPLIERKRRDLEARVTKASEANASLYLAIHCNSEVNPRWRGAQTFYNAGSAESRAIAQQIQHQLKIILGNTHRQAKAGSFFVTDRTPMAAVIVEVGFLSNYEEERLLKNPEYQARIAYAIFSGLVNYYANLPIPHCNNGV